MAKTEQLEETTTVDSSSTESVVVGVTFIQEVKQKASMWTNEIDGHKVVREAVETST